VLGPKPYKSATLFPKAETRPFRLGSLSSIPHQLPASPVLVFPIRVEDAFDVTV
jgi:hypothetical protein